MAIDIHSEDLLSLTEAAKALPKVSGKRPAVSTLWRWARKGLRGVRLEYVRVGRGIATSREALNRFFNALADADAPSGSADGRTAPPTLRPTDRGRSRMLDRADRILKEARI